MSEHAYIQASTRCSEIEKKHCKEVDREANETSNQRNEASLSQHVILSLPRHGAV